MVMSKTELKSVVKKIEELLNTEITLIPRSSTRTTEGEPPNPAGGGRIVYIPLPGTGSRFKLSPRAQQVYSFLTGHKHATSADLQAGLGINRNVVAGAIHELKAKHAVKTEKVLVGGQTREQVAAEHSGRRSPRRKPSGKRARKAGAK